MLLSSIDGLITGTGVLTAVLTAAPGAPPLAVTAACVLADACCIAVGQVGADRRAAEAGRRARDEVRKHLASGTGVAESKLRSILVSRGLEDEAASQIVTALARSPAAFLEMYAGDGEDDDSEEGEEERLRELLGAFLSLLCFAAAGLLPAVLFAAARGLGDAPAGALGGLSLLNGECTTVSVSGCELLQSSFMTTYERQETTCNNHTEYRSPTKYHSLYFTPDLGMYKMVGNKTVARTPFHNFDFRGCNGTVQDEHTWREAHPVGAPTCTDEGMKFEGIDEQMWKHTAYGTEPILSREEIDAMYNDVNAKTSMLDIKRLSVTVRCEENDGDCVLDGEKRHRIMQIEGPMVDQLKLVGLRLENGKTEHGGGAVHVSSGATATFERCSFIENEANEAGAVFVLPCKLEHACTPRMVNGTFQPCAKGHEGALCSYCQSGYAMVTGACELCEGGSTASRLIGAYVQIVAMLNFSLDLKFPKTFEDTTEAFGFANLDVMNVLPFGCYVRANHHDRLLLYTLTPMLISAVLLAVFFALRKSQTRKGIARSAFSVFLSGNSFILPMLTTLIFSTFPCKS
ncbi:hypothetical protein TeGR_g2014, partial [Tetraparma gracilis]